MKNDIKYIFLFVCIFLETVLLAQNGSPNITGNKMRDKEINPVGANAVIKEIDSKKLQILKIAKDSLRAKLFISIARTYSVIDPDSSLRYTGLALALYRKLSDKKGEIDAIWTYGWLYRQMGDYNKSQEYLLLAQNIATKENLPELMPANLLLMGANVGDIAGDYKKSIEFQKQALAIGIKYKITNAIIIAPHNLCMHYYELNKLDSAIYYGNMVLKNADSTNNFRRVQVYSVRAKLFECKKEWENAISVLKGQLNDKKDSIATSNRAGIFLHIAKIYKKWGKTDSAIYYAGEAFQMVKNTKFFDLAFDNAFLLYELYLTKDKLKALSYLTVANEKRETQLKVSRQFSLRNLEEFDVKEREYETQKAETIYQNNIQRIIFIAAISIILIIAIAVYVSNRRHRFLNRKLQSQKTELENSLQQLKSTQSQLIQSEKMASLGELTAGIAHEIQNPLNFVNNFSELNNELLQELGPLDKLGVTADQQDILKDLQSNSEKINHHGQRAASIVKGMLQHSRTSSGQKEPTDINALCDEYLRLAYHGLRAKDKSFNAEFTTEFDESIPKVNIVPQDMGRVVLNLINNAFFAVKQRQESQSSERQNVVRLGGSEREPNDDLTIRRPDEEYTPLVTVSTRKTGNTIIISVSDNGTGIPDDIKEKIFQPFFTTKPTGQGTGLGLSLSYDIVKAHGGELKVESEQGRGSKFIIELPI